MVNEGKFIVASGPAISNEDVEQISQKNKEFLISKLSSKDKERFKSIIEVNAKK